MDFPSDKRSQFSIPVLVLLSALSLSTYAPVISAINNSRIFRQRNVIQTVGKMAGMVPITEILRDPNFIKFSNQLKNMTSPPFIIFFDSGNLDIFLNHICNLEFYPGSVSRLAAVSFDQNATTALAQKYPAIPTVLVDLEPMKTFLPADYENRNYILYQLILLVRTRICALLALQNINFWAMQQDTIWFEDVNKLAIEQQYPDAHLIFDTVGNDQLPQYVLRMHNWICGSTFFVRGSPTTFQFFQQVDSFTRSHQSPDSTIMTYLCGHQGYRCQRLPKTMFSNSDYFRGTREAVPAMIQMDFNSKDGPKMEMFKKLRFRLRNDNGTCDSDAFQNLGNSVKSALPERIERNPIYEETRWQRVKYGLKKLFNVDPFNNKVFLTVHYSLV